MKVNITKTYEELNEFFKVFGNVFSKQRALIKDHMKDFFKYVNLEGMAYSELIKRREDLKQKCKNELIRITAKKEKLYSHGDINKMELNSQDHTIDRQKILHDKNYAFEHICYNDTRQLENLNNQLGYANKMNILELKKLINEYCVRYVNNIKTFNAEFYPSINDLVSSWSNMETFVMTSNLPKK